MMTRKNAALSEEIKMRTEQLYRMRNEFNLNLHNRMRSVAANTNRSRFQKMNYHRVCLSYAGGGGHELDCI